MPRNLLESRWWEGPAFLKSDFKKMLTMTGTTDENTVQEEEEEDVPFLWKLQ
jgi:hypothetical protein